MTKLIRGFVKRGFCLVPTVLIVVCCAASTTNEVWTNSIDLSARQIDLQITNAIHGGPGQMLLLLTNRISPTLTKALPREMQEVYSGTCLPSFFHNRAVPGEVMSDILTGTRFGSTEEEFTISRRWLKLLPELIHIESTKTVQLLKSRSERLPPDSIDLVVFVALQGVSWDRLSGDFWRKTRADWRRMLTAKNPVYRLVALQNISFFETSRRKALSECDSALRENNTIFQFWALQELQRLGGQAAVKSIEAFIGRRPHPNDGTLSLDLDIVSIAKEALDTCRSKVF
jgi:hypothetical protein